MCLVFGAIKIHYSRDNLIISDNALWVLCVYQIQSLLPAVALCGSLPPQSEQSQVVVGVKLVYIKHKVLPNYNAHWLPLEDVLGLSSVVNPNYIPQLTGVPFTCKH